MKSRCGLIPVMLIVAFGMARADVEIHGVLSTGSHTVQIDSVFMDFQAGQDSFRTPGWGGDSATIDSFDFPPVVDWPFMIAVVAQVAGRRRELMIPGPQEDSWYLFNAPPLEPRVMFWKTASIQESPQDAKLRPVLKVTPSVLVDRVVIQAQVTGPAQAVVDVFDAAGNRVRSFGRLDGKSNALSMVWQGKDDGGRRLPEGIYFCRLAAGDAATVRKVLLAR